MTGAGASLRGRFAIVTGGGRGLGRAYCRALASAGAGVAVVARSRDQVLETVAEIEKMGGRAAAFPADVTDEAAVRDLVASVERDLGPVDLLVSNAGTAGPIGPLWEVDAREWSRCLEVNLLGPLHLARAVLPGMVARGAGRIIHVSSAAGNGSLPGLSAYVTSKAALTRMTEVLAGELRGHGVSVFAIEPGTVRTAMTEEVLSSPGGRKWMPGFVRYFAEGRDISPERSAELVLFLASGKADRLSGRFISRADDLEDLCRRAEEILERDLHALRVGYLRRQPP